MGSFLSSLFVDPQTLPAGGYGVVQLLFLAAVYGFILMKASRIIADGSELLLLVLPPGIVGALLLPVLGAVPDGLLILFSGSGPDAQKQISVGVGTLAGSTVCLLTVPWLACAILGRVDLVKDKASGKLVAGYNRRPKLTKGFSWTETGIEGTSDIKWNAVIMLATCLTYFIIQSPAWAGSSESGVSKAALAGFIIAFLCFVAYSFYQLYSARAQELQAARQAAVRREMFAKQIVKLATLVQIEDAVSGGSTGDSTGVATAGGMGAPRNSRLSVFPGGANASGSGATASLLPSGDHHGHHHGHHSSVSHHALRKVFDRYDIDKNGVLTKAEIRAVFTQLGYKLTMGELDEVLHAFGGGTNSHNKSSVTFEEFEAAAKAHIQGQAEGKPTPQSFAKSSAASGTSSSPSTARKSEGALVATGGGMQVQEVEETEDDEEEEGDEEEEEGEEEHKNLTPRQIKLRAFGMLVFGVLLVTLFSDPMCDIISAMGDRISSDGKATFYLSFIFTPLISNASEIISSIIFAGKKTQKSIVLTYSQLLGAATMNNTFCLAIFLALVHFNNLSWNFGAEVTAIIAVQIVVGAVAMYRVTPVWRAAVAAAMYPICLALVAGLEAAGMQ